MSEFYEDDEVDQQQQDMEMEQQTPQPAKKERYKSTKDQTKRREQAIANLAKGRATRLANLAKKKEMSITPTKRKPIRMEYYEDESSSGSEEYVLERKSRSQPLPKSRKPKQDPYNDRMERIEMMLERSMKPKVKKPRAPTPIVRPRTIDPLLQSVKKVLLDL